MIRFVRFFMTLVVLMGLIACESAAKKDADTDKSKEVAFTMVQYNVGVFSKYAESGIAAVAGAVKEMAADVVTLNELDSCTSRTGNVYQLEAFASAMGKWAYHYASAMPYKGGAYGVGVASRPDWKIIRTDKVILPKFDGNEPRALAVVEYEDFVICAISVTMS